MRPLLALGLLACGASSHDGRDAGSAPPDPDAAACADPSAPGCPCDATGPEVCYSAPEETAGVGTCEPGLRSCEDAVWTGCIGEVVPGVEVCDFADNDCDGEVDEGLLSLCGDCNPNCTLAVFGHEPGEQPFEPRRGECSVEEGDLVVPPHGGHERSVWIPSTLDGTISLVDAGSREERARFRTGGGGGEEEPSRTAVGWDGEVYVANRAPGGQSSVTKVLSFGCPDADGDGRVETSQECDDVLPWGDDECVVWNAPVGEEGGRANAIAEQVRAGLDGTLDHRVWVGLEAEERYVELDAETGEATGNEAQCSGCRPVGARADWERGLWSACDQAAICAFDTTAPELVRIVDLPEAGSSARGLALDWLGRVWVGGDVLRYDPLEGTFTEVPGVSAASLAVDGEGDVWVGGCADAATGLAEATCRIDGDTLEVTSLDAPSGGVDVDDYYGAVWAVHERDGVAVIDLETLEVETASAECDPPDGPDTWSAMVQPLLLDEGATRCAWRALVEGCDPPVATSWVRLEWSADVPGGAQVFLDAAATDDPSLEGVDLETVASSADGSSVDIYDRFPGSRYLVVQVRLQGWGATPVLHSLRVQWSCWQD